MLNSIIFQGVPVSLLFVLLAVTLKLRGVQLMQQ